MDRNAFHQLLKRYIEGTCSQAEAALVNQWYELLDEQEELSAGNREIYELENRMWDTIKDRITGQVSIKDSGSVKSLRRISFKWASVAAILIVCMVGAFLYSAKIKRVTGTLISAKVAEGLSEEINSTELPKKLLLEDGSIIILQPKAKIAFARHFLKDRREVYLEGEAFFDVAKNTAKPFFVYNGRLVTKVLGTSFNVKIIKDKTEVSVRTGRVAVYENGREVNLNEQQKKNNGVIITPNQKVTYYTENRHFVTSLVDVPIVVPVENNQGAGARFVFDDTPLSEVLAELEKSYAIEIILANKDLNNCPFTGDLSQQSIFHKLEFICQAFQSDYEVKGTRILINGGKGCP
ncbi:MAG: FecR domain-containing protein [Ferruginibacter sp.]|nr:FecR domain-containing protein [Ferruginibacter sp.]